jgi:hypothetical protein
MVLSNSEHFKFFTFFVATAAILKFLSLKIMCTHVRQNFWKVSSNSEHHSKPTMNINSQHYNLLGNQMLPKSEDFCIWRPFCTLVTMARNIHRSVWQLLGGGVEKIQNGGRWRCHGNQGTKWPPNTKSLRFGQHLVSK